MGARVRRTAVALAWSVGLLAGLALPAEAQDRTPLTPAAIAEFEQKLTAARTARADIARRVTCFAGQKTLVIQKRDADQLRLGQLVAHQKELAPVLVRQEAEYKGFETIRNDEQATMDRLQGELTELERKKRSQERALENCKAEWWTINAVCELAYGLAHLTGRFTDNRTKIDETRGRLDTAARKAGEAEGRYRASKRDYDTSVTDEATTRSQITAAETSIGRWQAALSALETSRHESAGLLDQFDTALDDAKEIDTADGQASTARLVRTLAVRVDQDTQQSADLLRKARDTLTEQELRACL
jgi:hypothetical protein